MNGPVDRFASSHLLRDIGVPVALLLLVSAVYSSVGGFPFVRYDDYQYLPGNPIVARGLTVDGVLWAFTTFHAANWHPLTWLSHMLDVEIFGLASGRHHIVNALLHAVNTLLLFGLLRGATGSVWRSAFAAVLFGVHPLHVESVAWISERKDLLCAFFLLSGLAAWRWHVASPSLGRYLAVVAAFALSLMSKPMAVTFPFLLLLVDVWPLRRAPSLLAGLSPRVVEKLPLFAMSAAASVVTLFAQSGGGAVTFFDAVPFVFRVGNALEGYGVYLAKTVWPSSLTIFYPHPATTGEGLSLMVVSISVVVLGATSHVAFRERERRPWLLSGWLWFLGSLVPVIGFVQVGDAAYADRYTYLPLVGVFVAVAWGVAELATWTGRRSVAVVLCVAVVLSLSVVAWRQTGFWRDDVSLFSRAIAATERNWWGMNNLAAALGERGQNREALALATEAAQINPRCANAWYVKGVALQALGRPDYALDAFLEAVRIEPDYAAARINADLLLRSRKKE